MISYEKYMNFESGKIDMYDIARDDICSESLPFDYDIFPRIEKEQFSYKLFRKCSIVTIRVRYMTKSFIELSEDGKWIRIYVEEKSEWDWESFFENAVNMRFLHIEGNSTTVPDRIFDCNKLIYLNLEDCNIGKGLEKLSNLKSLQFLALNCSTFEALPDDIGSLHELVGLLLVRTTAYSIPKSLEQLQKLRVLRIGGGSGIPRGDFSIAGIEISYALLT